MTPAEKAAKKVATYSFIVNAPGSEIIKPIDVVSAETAIKLETELDNLQFTKETMNKCLDLANSERKRLEKYIEILIAMGKLTREDYELAKQVYIAVIHVD